MAEGYEEIYEGIKVAMQEYPEFTKEEKDIMLDTLEKAMPYIKAICNMQDKLALTPEETYVINYLQEHNNNPNPHKTAYDVTLLLVTSMMFVHDHKEAVIAMNDAATRIELVKKLTAEDLKEIKLDIDGDEIQQLRSNNAPTWDDLLEIIGFGNVVELYEKYQKTIYRTKAKALEDGALDAAPNNIAVLTNPLYQWGMSLYQDGGAHLQLLTSTDGLKFKGGKMYFDNMQEVSEVELQNMKTKEGIEEIDLMTLRIFYSIILKKFEANDYKRLDDVITMYVPDLAECIGTQRNLNKKNLESLLVKAQSFHNIIGVLHGTRNGKPSKSLYPVLNFEGYDEKKNTISFSSPYMNYLIRTVYNISVRKDKQGKPKLKKNGEPMRLATHSYLIDTSISKEKNKAAAENVAIIVTLIEQAGNNIPRIKASTIVERNPQLQKRLEDDPAHVAQILKRTFTKTWELLQTKTRLKEVYKDIKLPDPKDPAAIPTKSTLSNLVYSFPHNGKK